MVETLSHGTATVLWGLPFVVDNGSIFKFINADNMVVCIDRGRLRDNAAAIILHNNLNV
ncbi:MAG: hypothetical protein H7070_16375 [Saprospiraceae bacterium]|nr:hypothetical protein [Pyrinomonadaceae bacterium]